LLKVLADIYRSCSTEKNIELKSYAYYEPDILQIEDIYTPTEIKTIKKNGEKREVGQYNLEYHLKKNISRDAENYKFTS